MSQLTIRIPASLERPLTELAREDAVSIDQFVSSAIAEKISAVLTLKYLKDRAAKGSREDLRQILNAVPDVEPENSDQL